MNQTLQWFLKRALFVAFFVLLVHYFGMAYFQVSEIQIEKVKEIQEEKGRGKKYVMSFCNGRLGNQMSSYSTLWGLHKMYGFTPVLYDEQFERLNSVFENIRIEHRPFKSIVKVSWKYPFRSGKNGLMNYTGRDYEKLPSNVQIEPYPNSISIFKNQLHVLRKHFTFKKPYQKKAEKIIEDMVYRHKKKHKIHKKEKITFVSIHVRKTDYKRHLKKLYNYTTISDKYLLKSIKFYKRIHKNPLFFVLSDNVKECKNIFRNIKNVVFPQVSKIYRSSPGLDLCIMSKMNHSIVTYGTYGLWGAILGGGQILVPKGYNKSKETKEIIDAKFKNILFL